MKICLLTRGLSLEGGGISRVASEIQTGLIKKGHEVETIFTTKTSLYSYFMYTAMEVPMRLPRGCDIYHAITPMESIWIPKEKGVSVILDIIALTHPGMYGGRLGYEKGIVTFHDIFTITHPGILGAGISSSIKKEISKRYFEFACRQALKCKYVVVVSEHVKNELVRYFKVPEGKIRVIKSGIREDLEPKPKKDNILRIGYLGQLDKRKRVHLLIDAFKKSHIKGELVIGGRGLEEKALKAQAVGDSRIKFLGLVPDEALVDFYNSLDVFVFPTAIEGYGLPPVEAMACKKPVVLLKDSIIPLDVKSRCKVVEDLEFVLKYKETLSNVVSKVNVEDNYKWAKTHNWDKIIDEYIDLYKEVIG